MKGFFSLIMSLLFFSNVLGQNEQSVRLFSNPNFGNPYIDFTSDQPTLSGWDNVARSYNYKGVWIFYENSNFNQGFNDKSVEWAWGTGMKNFQYLDRQVSSLRFAGYFADSTRDSLTVYSGLYFQHKEEMTLDQLPYFSNVPIMRSLIITGSTPWTVYSEINFRGTPICIFPPSSPNEPGLATNIYDILQIQTGWIKSARVNCDPSAKIFRYIKSSKVTWKV